MLRIYPEQLHEHLNKGLHTIYLLVGNDPFLLQESQNAICKTAIKKGFNEYYTFQVDKNTNWKEIFFLCKTTSLFSSRKILVLILPEDSTVNTTANKKLIFLTKFLHSDLLLIIRINKLIKTQENSFWFRQLTAKTVLVMCQIPEHTRLSQWIITLATQRNLQIDESSCQLLCYYYEGNLLALTQILDQFLLLWPDGNLTLPRVKEVANDISHFMPFHWVDALLAAKTKRAFHILQRLYFEESEPIILLRILQREILLLISLKRQEKTTSLQKLFDEYRVWNNRKAIISQAINRFTYNQLRKVIHLLAQSELNIKQRYSQSIWDELGYLSLLLCCNNVEKKYHNQ